MRLLIFAALIAVASPACADQTCVFLDTNSSSTAAVPDDVTTVTFDWANGSHEVCRRDGDTAHCPDGQDHKLFFVQSAPDKKKPWILVVDETAWFQISCGAPA